MSPIIITEDHWIAGAVRVPLPAPHALPIHRYVVEHFTGGATAHSSAEAMRERGVSAHVVVDRDGTILQCVPFNRKAAHAGVSRWRDPKTGTLYSSAKGLGGNDCAIGIEIANTGSDPGALSWARKQPGFASIQARHRNGGPLQEWEIFYGLQLAAVRAITEALVASYHLDDITGHDCIAPERKDDPGPAFPMQMIREACGFTGLPAVHQK